jgi:hypothetical protein
VSSERSSSRSGPPQAGQRVVSALAYLALLLLGAAEALIGAFQYSRGPAPLASLCFALGILATCLLGGWGMRAPGGGLMPGVGWFVAAFVLASGTQGGSVLITNTMAGEWFLFGGAAGAAVGCLLAYVRWARPRAAAGGRPGPAGKAGRR